MSLSRLGLSVLIAAGLALGTGHAATAATVNLEYEGSNAWGDPSWATRVDYTLNGVATSHGSGVFRVRDADTGESFLAWCIDLFTTLKLPNSHDTSVASATDAQLENINKLFTTAYTQVVDAVTASGFQIALWEIMTDTGSMDGLDLTNGDFITTGSGAQYTQASTFLNDLANAGPDTYTVTTYYSAVSQNLVRGELAPVPAPASAILLLGGIGGLAAMRRRKSRAL